jgi:hypothetical protein
MFGGDILKRGFFVVVVIDADLQMPNKSTLGMHVSAAWYGSALPALHTILFVLALLMFDP